MLKQRESVITQTSSREDKLQIDSLKQLLQSLSNKTNELEKQNGFFIQTIRDFDPYNHWNITNFDQALESVRELYWNAESRKIPEKLLFRHAQTISMGTSQAPTEVRFQQARSTSRINVPDSTQAPEQFSRVFSNRTVYRTFQIKNSK